MPKANRLEATPALLMPLIAGLILASCGSGPQGTCTALSLVTGDGTDVGMGMTISRDDCFDACRNDDLLFGCRFTPVQNRSGLLPTEPM